MHNEMHFSQSFICIWYCILFASVYTYVFTIYMDYFGVFILAGKENSRKPENGVFFGIAMAESSTSPLPRGLAIPSSPCVYTYI